MTNELATRILKVCEEELEELRSGYVHRPRDKNGKPGPRNWQRWEYERIRIIGRLLATVASRLGEKGIEV